MKELRYITLAQVIGCILVIWGHSFPFVTPLPETVIKCRTFLYAFHMPLFVFCSGFLFAYTGQSSRKSFGTFFTLRAKRLLIPYLVFSLIGLLPKFIFSSYLNDSLQLDTISLARAFLVPRENIWGHFWFLPMIFFLGVISFLIDKYLFIGIDRRFLWGIVSGVSLVLVLLFKPIDALMWFGVNDIMQFGWSFAIGVETYYCWGDISSSIHSPKSALLIGGGMILFILILWNMFKMPAIIVAISMIGAIILLCVGGEDFIPINRNSTIAQTYQIFILSWPCQLIVEIILERILHLSWWIVMLSVFIIGIIGPLLILKMIYWFENRTKTHLLSTILGK